MAGKNKNINPDLSEFLRYKNGEMTGSERNAFERELQKNPFLQEALEGYESLQSADLENDISALGERLGNRTRQKRRYIIYRIAASVAVLMIVSSVFFILERNKKTTAPPLSEQESVPFTIARSEPFTRDKEQPPSEKKQEMPARERKEADVKKDFNVPPTGNKPEVSVQQQDQPAPAANDEEKKVQDNLAETEVQAPSSKPAERSEALANQDLAAARKSISYEAKAARAGGAVSQDYKAPEPENGKEAFDNYVDENIRRPDSSRQRIVVETRFTVKTDGSIDSIKVLKSPGVSFSNEAKRLIRSGPRWKPALRNGLPVNDSVRLMIIFR